MPGGNFGGLGLPRAHLWPPHPWSLAAWAPHPPSQVVPLLDRVAHGGVLSDRLPPPPSQVMPLFDQVARELAAEHLGTQEDVPEIQVCGGVCVCVTFSMCFCMFCV